MMSLAGATLAVALAAGAHMGYLRRHEPRHHAERPLERARSLGFTLERLDAATARSLGPGTPSHGAVVTSVATGSPAEHAGLAIGDVVTEIDGRAPLKAASDKPPQTLVVLHHGMVQTLQLAYPDAAE